MKAQMRLPIVICLFVSELAVANSFSQRLATYSENNGDSISKLEMGASVNSNQTEVGPTTFNLLMSQTAQVFGDISENKYAKTVIGSDKLVSNTVVASVSQNIKKLTDIRFLGSTSKDEVNNSQSIGLGISQWFYHETFQISLDYSESTLSRPYFETINAEMETIFQPEVVNSKGMNLSLRHLAGPKTVLIYKVGAVKSTDRPELYTYGVEARRYVEKLSGALHLNVARAVNEGEIGFDTSYGEVRGDLVDLSYVTNLSPKARLKTGYRYYKEDELTRAEDKRVTTGTDTVSAAVVVELPKGSLGEGVKKASLHAGAATYATNLSTRAGSYELGLVTTL